MKNDEDTCEFVTSSCRFPASLRSRYLCLFHVRPTRCVSDRLGPPSGYTSPLKVTFTTISGAGIDTDPVSGICPPTTAAQASLVDTLLGRTDRGASGPCTFAVTVDHSAFHSLGLFFP